MASNPLLPGQLSDPQRKEGREGTLPTEAAGVCSRSLLRRGNVLSASQHLAFLLLTTEDAALGFSAAVLIGSALHGFPLGTALRFLCPTPLREALPDLPWATKACPGWSLSCCHRRRCPCRCRCRSRSRSAGSSRFGACRGRRGDNSGMGTGTGIGLDTVLGSCASPHRVDKACRRGAAAPAAAGPACLILH